MSDDPKFRTTTNILRSVYLQNRWSSLIGLLVASLGMVLIVLPDYPNSELSLLQRLRELLTAKNIGYLLAVIGMSVAYLPLLRAISRRRAKSFSDIDEERKTKSHIYGANGSEELILELRSLRNSSGIDYGKIEEIIRKTQQKEHQSGISSVKTFDDYFKGVIGSLSARALDSDARSVDPIR